MVVYALLGTSRSRNIGPESSVAVLVASSLAPLAAGDPDRYAALAGLLAILVGGFLLVGYLARLGVITRLLSAPVLTGYLAGSAIVIILGHLTKITGITLPDAGYPTLVGGIAQNLDQVNLWALGFAAGTAMVVLGVLRFAPRLPAPLIALVAATAIVSLFGLADRLAVVGRIGTGVPVPRCPTPVPTTPSSSWGRRPASPCWCSPAACSRAGRWPPATARTWTATASSSVSGSPTWPPGCCGGSRPTPATRAASRSPTAVAAPR
jgi:MFS superfamily sulfate permease-like transporter